MNYSESVKIAFTECIAFLKPHKRLKLSVWADEKAYLSPESAHEPGKWKTIAYQREPMDCVTEFYIDEITWMKSARVGFTKLLNNVIGYHIEHDPKSILMVQPTVEDAQGYSKEELAPMLRDTPCLQGLVSEAKSRDSNNTILKKSYPGGFTSLVGANSARGFRRISVPIVLFDETDGYPPTAGQEGDQIKLGTKRTEWFWDRKIIKGSTPTIKGLSRIEDSFEASDKRFYNVPCPFCGKMQTIEFERLKWPKGDPEKAALECIGCKKLIPHSKKRWMIDRGKWIATKPFTGHAGFFIWAGYSIAPNATWGHIAKEFLDCKDNREKFKTFWNTTLGRTWEEDGEKPEWELLKNRSEAYELLTVSRNAWLITMGVDTQDDRLEFVLRAWGRDEESWLMHFGQVYGDPAKPEVWQELDGILNREYLHEEGFKLTISSIAVDTGGHKTQDVYNYCRKRSPRVMAIKGGSQSNRPIISKPSTVDVNWRGEKVKNGCKLWVLGVDTAKSTIYSRLKLNEPGPGYYHFPIGIEDEYFMQLTAEKQIKRYIKGFPVLEWIKEGPRNEALDCEVYAYAAALRIGLIAMNWDRLEKNIRERHDKRNEVKPPKKQPSKKSLPKPKNWFR